MKTSTRHTVRLAASGWSLAVSTPFASTVELAPPNLRDHVVIFVLRQPDRQPGSNWGNMTLALDNLAGGQADQLKWIKRPGRDSNPSTRLDKPGSSAARP